MRAAVLLCGLAVCSIILLVAVPFVPRNGEPVEWDLFWSIFWNLRVPRALQGYFAGASLALAGALIQSLCSNPLATPYTLGIASGGAFGVALVVGLGCGTSQVLGFSGIYAGAFCGSLIAALCSLGVSRVIPASSTSVILGGVVASFFFSSLVVLVQYVIDMPAAYVISRWLLGDVQAVGMQSVAPVVVSAVAALGVSMAFCQHFDLASLGYTLAMSRGLELRSMQTYAYLMIALITGVTVASAGPIGFVGIIVPNVVRLCGITGHRLLIPASFLAGGLFLFSCDQIALLVLHPIELPVGVVTALLGGPFFLALLVSRRLG